MKWIHLGLTALILPICSVGSATSATLSEKLVSIRNYQSASDLKVGTKFFFRCRNGSARSQAGSAVYTDVVKGLTKKLLQVSAYDSRGNVLQEYKLDARIPISSLPLVFVDSATGATQTFSYSDGDLNFVASALQNLKVVERSFAAKYRNKNNIEVHGEVYFSVGTRLKLGKILGEDLGPVHPVTVRFSENVSRYSRVWMYYFTPGAFMPIGSHQFNEVGGQIAYTCRCVNRRVKRDQVAA